MDLVAGRDGALREDAGYGTGEVGRAFAFDGFGDTVAVADSPAWTLGHQDFSIDTWVYFAAVGGPTALVAHDEAQGSVPKWILWFDGSTLSIYLDTSVERMNVVSVPWTPSAGQWYHVAATRKADTWSLYLDGEQVAEEENSIAVPDAAAPLTLGSAEEQFFLNGRLDEVQLFRRALTSTEVKSIHDAGGSGLCAPFATSMSLDASARSIHPGQRVRLSGQLVVDGLSAGSQAITLTRQIDTRPPTVVKMLQTATDGTFAFGDEPPEGRATYTATFLGADGALPAEATVAVRVFKRSTSLTLSASRTRLTYGQSTALTAHLKGGATNRRVSFFAKPVGRKRILVARAAPSRNGHVTVTVKPKGNADYWATYEGTDTWAATRSKAVPVSVAGRWGAKSLGGYATSSGYRLYHYSSACSQSTAATCPTESFSLAPRYPGEKVVVTFQDRSRGRWSGTSYTWRLNRRSTIVAFTWYTTSGIIGVPHRVRATFSGDAQHGQARSRWVYWKVTR